MVSSYQNTAIWRVSLMASALRISEATSLAIHTMALLAKEPEAEPSSREISETLHVSLAHLQKVLQRLGRSGLVRSARGRSGGFRLARPAETIRLREVYESIEGPLDLNSCLLDPAVCAGRKCGLGGLVEAVNAEFADYLDRTTVAALDRTDGRTTASRTKERLR
jgi:Rrf2 family protein